MRRLLPSLLVAALFLVAACSDTVVDPGNTNTGGNGGGNNGGGTVATVSFSSDVLPMLSASCAGGGCHVGQTTSGVNLSSRGQILSSVGSQYGTEIVSVGNGAGSPIVDKVNASPQLGSRMPLGRSSLSAAQITTLTTWIDEGALDN